MKLTKKTITDKIKTELKYHLSDSTAMASMINPIFAALEVSAFGMTIPNSINARLIGTGLTYAGMGRLYSKGMDLSRKVFKIKPETKVALRKRHDRAYSIAYNLIVSPIFYYAAGSRDIEQIALGTGVSVAFGLVAGGWLGSAVDQFRDLSGLENSKRLPNVIAESSPKMKKGLVALLAAASIGLTAETYNLKTQYEQYFHPKTEAIQNYENNGGTK